MKILLNSIFLMILSFPCFSQNNEKGKLNLIFIDECSNKIITPEFEIDSFPKLNYKLITIYVERKVDLISHYSTTLKTNNDTIIVPKILISFGSELHTQRWNYLNCNSVCNGTETDFYSNGNKRLLGIFKNGKLINKETEKKYIERNM